MNKNSAKTKTQKIELYDLLNVEKTSTKDEIKKAYRVLALKVHPDKNPNDAEASDKFSSLHNAYTILMDDDKREHYDETGEIDNSVEIDLEGAYEYYKNVYPTITEKDIEDFSQKYKNSELEMEDLEDFYLENKGDLTNLLEFIPLSTNEDVPRFLSIFEELFHEKTLKKTKLYNSTKNKIKLLEEEDQDEVQEEKGKFKDLCSQIIAKKTQRNNYLDDLEKKFGGKKSNGNGYDIDEEEFKNIQKKFPQEKKKHK